MLEVRDIEVERGGRIVLSLPSLSIEQGEILSLIGPNGAGKTTLLQVLCFLLKPSRGEISFKGERIRGEQSTFAYRRKITMVFQEPLLFDTTVYDNIASGLRIRGMGRKEIDRIVMEQLDRFGIAHLRRRSARKISGGEAQRTSLARAFALEPEILFLDEPFLSLDPPARENLIEDLDRILKQTATTAIFATHDRQEALRLSDRIAVMNRGKIVQIGSAVEVMNHPVDEFVASFVGVETILTGKVVKEARGAFVASISGCEVEAAGEAHVGEEVVLAIRPEQVTLTTQLAKERTSARNLFSGKIEKIISLGPYQKVQLDCGFPLVAYVTHQSVENLSLREGKVMMASFKATSVHVIRRRPLGIRGTETAS